MKLSIFCHLDQTVGLDACCFSTCGVCVCVFVSRNNATAISVPFSVHSMDNQHQCFRGRNDYVRAFACFCWFLSCYAPTSLVIRFAHFLSSSLVLGSASFGFLHVLSKLQHQRCLLHSSQGDWWSHTRRATCVLRMGPKSHCVEHRTRRYELDTCSRDPCW